MLNAIAAALGPVFAVIVMGYALKRWSIMRGPFGARFWPAAENMTYFVLLPSLLFLSLARADLGAVSVAPLVASLSGTIVIVAGLVLAARPWLRLSGPAFSSVMQSAIRPNTYVGVAPVFALWGEDGLALLAVGIVSVIPLVNLLSVIAVSRFATAQTQPGPWAMLGLIARNPLIIACVVGLALGAYRPGMLTGTMVGAGLSMAAGAAIPLALLLAGFGLSGDGLRSHAGILAVATVGKLIVVPGLTWLAGWWLGCEPAAVAAAVFLMAAPTAMASVPMARLLGGDVPLAVAGVTATTVAAVFSLAGWLVAMGWWMARG